MPTGPTCGRTARGRGPLGGAAEDPVAALRESGYVARVTAERGATAATVGGWGR